VNIVFYHVPRTAGSTMWHSIAHSFSPIENLEIMDTYYQSLKRFGCANHEEEILQEFLLSNTKENSLIHVHSKIKFYELENIDLLIFGKRNIFTWRTSMITHFYIKQCHNWRSISPEKHLNCVHSRKCKVKNSFRSYLSVLYETTTDSNYKWINHAIPKICFRKYQILTYSGNIVSQRSLGNSLREILAPVDDSIEFVLKRYGSTNSDLMIRGSHDSTDLPRFLGLFVNIITLPVFLFLFFYEALLS
jgi:hypothetical protein